MQSPDVLKRSIVTALLKLILVKNLSMLNITINQNEKQVSKSISNSVKNICNDKEVCQPSQAQGNGNPIIIVSGASTGNTYHHFVKTEKEITVRGNINFHVNCFIVLFCPNRLAPNVCVSAVVPFGSRVLSHETKTLSEDKTLYQLVTAPLQKHAVASCGASFVNPNLIWSVGTF